eukprot:TRINITY_DN2009_c0_g2_i3.p1 TRINITY_DN2009_c0_g2~~TRINITY_DN2009_c0_g2_i3.p1  ORF type:complete len:682 (+),score=172.68 TRINITY_DN2009_c0_g2_i3:485-2530(+)
MLLDIVMCVVCGVVVHVGDLPGLKSAHGVVEAGGLVYASSTEWLLVLRMRKEPVWSLEVVGSCYIYYAAEGSRSVYVEGGHAYVLGYSGLAVVDVSDVAHPRVISSYRTAPTYSLQIVNGTAYLLTYNELYALDVTTPSRPTLLSVYTHLRSCSFCGLAVANSTVYLVAAGVLVSLNYSDPAYPSLVNVTDTGLAAKVDSTLLFNSTLYFSGTFASGPHTAVYDVAASPPAFVGYVPPADTMHITNGTAYVSYQTMLYEYSMPTPATFVELTTRQLPGCRPLNIYASDLTYVACSWEGLLVYPLHGGSEETHFAGDDLYDMALQGDYLYFVNHRVLYVADVSNPASPEVVAQLAVPKYGDRLCVSGSMLLYATGSSIKAVDVSNPLMPFALPTEIEFFGTSTFVGEGGVVFASSSALPVIEAIGTGNQTLTPLGNITGYAVIKRNIAVSKGRLFALTTLPSPSLIAFDVADPFSMQEVGSMLVGTGGGNGLAVDGDRAYYVYNGTLHVVDISDPRSMRVVGTLEVLDGDEIFSAAGGDTVYLAVTSSLDSTLLTVDVTGDQPTIVAEVTPHVGSRKLLLGTDGLLCIMNNMVELWAQSPTPSLPTHEPPTATPEEPPSQGGTSTTVNIPTLVLAVVLGVSLLPIAYFLSRTKGRPVADSADQTKELGDMTDPLYKGGTVQE